MKNIYSYMFLVFLAMSFSALSADMSDMNEKTKLINDNSQTKTLEDKLHAVFKQYWNLIREGGDFCHKSDVEGRLLVLAATGFCNSEYSKKGTAHNFFVDLFQYRSTGVAKENYEVTFLNELSYQIDIVAEQNNLTNLLKSSETPDNLATEFVALINDIIDNHSRCKEVPSALSILRHFLSFHKR